jgi:spermidine synthase
MQKTTTGTRTFTLLAITFVVSFCSFAYEFVYSELLTVMYGGTVTQYVITIGLYFFSLGVGSALSDDLIPDRWSNFFRTELYLAAAAPAGFMLIVALNSVTLPAWIPYVFVWILARLPVIVVGVLSGFELPLLTRLVDEVAADSDSTPPVPAQLRSLFDRLHAGGRRCLEMLWHTDTGDNSIRSGLSVVLAIDYVGGLFGAVIYARVLYPQLGLVSTIFVLALLNALAALVFVVQFSAWGGFTGESSLSISALVSHESRVLLAVCLLLTVGYAGAVVNHEQVDHRVTELYREHQIESEFPADTMDIEIMSQKTTKYQHILRYRRTWTGNGSNPYFTGKSEQCLRLGTAVQLCESWADSYHNGLVDVPMSMYEHSPKTDVLVIGGGDWIAINHLRKYNVSIDHVDIDRQFMQYAKSAFFQERHNASYTYPRLNTTVGDGYTYLQRTNQTYDLILLDTPGATNDDLLKLYSKEFYRLLRGHLENDGVVVSWAYSSNAFPQHNKAYINTVRAAGFTQYIPYWAWEDIDSDGQTERIEQFYMLAPDKRAPPQITRRQETDYVHRYSERYSDLRWKPVPHYNGVPINSIFHPNYDIIIDT